MRPSGVRVNWLTVPPFVSTAKFKRKLLVVIFDEVTVIVGAASGVIVSV